MGLFDDDDDFSFEEEQNPYLEDPDKGIELISILLSFDKKSVGKRKTIEKLDYLLDRKLFEISDKVNLSNELELYERLVQLTDKLFEQNKMQLLKNKSVIGIGGKFSAGKSKFINALLDSEILPEDQTPTTSIATYIVRSQEEEVRAYTYNDQDILLDMEAAQALTHAFYKKYKLGFSQFINNLVINVPNFDFENVALLDTPGYSKADSGVKRSASDAEKAFSQLKAADFLIWLVDMENGVIQQPDIEFMRSLKTQNPILVIFNKADKKTSEGAKKILHESREILSKSGLNIFGVTAYSALDAEEYFGGNLLEYFMEKANSEKNRNEDIVKQIREINNSITQQLQKERKHMLQRRNEIGEIIFRSEDIMEIHTLVKVYAEVIGMIKKINNYSFAIDQIKKDINKLLATIS